MIINIDDDYEITASLENNLDIDSISEFDFDSIFSNISTTLIYDNNSNNYNTNKLLDNIISKFDDMGIEGYLFTDNKTKYGKEEIVSNNYDIFKYKESRLDYLLNLKNDVIERCKNQNFSQFIIFDNCYIKEGYSNDYKDYDCIDETIKDLLNNYNRYQFYLIFVDRENSYLPQSIRFNIDYVFIYNDNDEYNGLLFSYFGSEFQRYNLFVDTIEQMRSMNNYLVIIKNSLKYYNNEKIFYYDFEAESTTEIINKCLDHEYEIIIDI